MLAKLVLLLVAGNTLFPISASFVNPYKDDKQAAVKSDLKYIRCQVCTLIVKQARAYVKNARLTSGSKKLQEADIIDHLEKICDPDSVEGVWISHLDMVEVNDRIDVIDVGRAGECNSECRTIARACNDIMEKADITELSELLYLDKKGRAGIQQWLCYTATSACTKPAPAVAKDRQPGPQHVPISDDKLQAKQMMQRMKAAGMGGQMYNTEDLLEQMKGAPPEDGGMSEDEMLEAYDRSQKGEPGLQGQGPDGGSAFDQAQSVLSKGGEFVQEGAKKVVGSLGKLRERVAEAVSGLQGGAGTAKKTEL